MTPSPPHHSIVSKTGFRTFLTCGLIDLGLFEADVGNQRHARQYDDKPHDEPNGDRFPKKQSSPKDSEHRYQKGNGRAILL